MVFTLVKYEYGSLASDDRITGIESPFSQLFSTPADEAQFWRWLYQDYDQWPGPVVTRVVTKRYRPPPDGRVEVDAGHVGEGFGTPPQPNECSVIDQRGTLVHGTFQVNARDYPRVPAFNELQGLLDWLTRPVTTAPPASAATPALSGTSVSATGFLTPPHP